MFRLFIVIILCQELLTVASIKAKSPTSPAPCKCEKGDKGEQGDPGVCPANCIAGQNLDEEFCLGTNIKLQYLAQSLRQLVIDTKQIASQNARTAPCMCPAPPPPPPPSTTTNTLSTTSNQFIFDADMRARLKGEKGDKGEVGASCTLNCESSVQLNIRVFRTIKEAMDAYSDYPDHTYVHIVNDQGRLQRVLVRVQERLVPIRVDIERAIPVQGPTVPMPITTPKPKCSFALSCPSLHMFALGPQPRKMCYPTRPNLMCSKLSEYDSLCGRIAQRHNLKGYYRAFMSTSTQWLANLFDGICMNANFKNIREELLFNSYEEIFERKAAQHEILDAQGLKPQFLYWWHGSLPNGTASSNTCFDWSRQSSAISGMASRLSNSGNGLFHKQYIWPCSIGDSNIGILCIETNCDRATYYKH